MWPFTKIRGLEEEVDDLRTELREVEAENEELLRKYRAESSRPPFHVVSKDFDISKIEDAILQKTLKEMQPMFKEELFRVLSRINFRDTKQARLGPSSKIAMTDSVETYAIEINIPSLSCRFEVFGG